MAGTLRQTLLEAHVSNKSEATWTDIDGTRWTWGSGTVNRNGQPSNQAALDDARRRSGLDLSTPKSAPSTRHTLSPA